MKRRRLLHLHALKNVEAKTSGVEFHKDERFLAKENRDGSYLLKNKDTGEVHRLSSEEFKNAKTIKTFNIHTKSKIGL